MIQLSEQIASKFLRQLAAGQSTIVVIQRDIQQKDDVKKADFPTKLISSNHAKDLTRRLRFFRRRRFVNILCEKLKFHIDMRRVHQTLSRLPLQLQTIDLQ